MIDPRMWDDPEFYALDDTTKLVWLYLLTGTESDSGCAGLQTQSPSSLAAAIRRSPVDVDAALRRLGELGWLEEDRRLRVIRVPNAPTYRIGIGNHAYKSTIWKWYRAWCRIPDCELKYKHVESVMEVVNVTSSTWQRTFGKVEYSSELDRIRKSEHSKSSKAVEQLPLSLEKSENIAIPNSHTQFQDVYVLSRSSSSGQEPVGEDHLPRARARNERAEEPSVAERPRAQVLWERLQQARAALDLPVELPTPGALGRVQANLAPYGRYTEEQLAHCVDAAALAAKRSEDDEWKLGPDLWHPNVLDRLLTARAAPRKTIRGGPPDTDLAAHWAAIEAEIADDDGPVEVGPMPWDAGGQA